MNNWQTKKIENCLDKIIYTSKIQRRDFLESGNFPIISQEAEFINGHWNNKKDLFKIEKPVIIFGDHTQVLKYVDFDFVLGADGVKILLPKKNLDSRFFYYFLQNVDLKSLGYARHFRLLKEIEISFPESLPEQRRIVKILDEVFEKITKAKENTEKNLKNSRELFESYLQSVFAKPEKDWEEKKLGEVTDYLARGISPKYVDGGGVSVLNQKCIRNHEVSYGEARQHNHIAKKYDKNKLIQIGDVLVNSTGVGTLGRVAQVKAIENLTVVDSHITIVRPQKNLFYDRFFGWAMIYVEDLIKELGAGASGQTELSRITLKELEISYPKSLTEQKSIVKKLEALSTETKKLEAIYTQKLADLEELKKLVLKKAFAGEL